MSADERLEEMPCAFAGCEEPVWGESIWCHEHRDKPKDGQAECQHTGCRLPHVEQSPWCWRHTTEVYARYERERLRFRAERAEADLEALRERAEKAERALEEADDLLLRLDQWDVMQVTGDGPYWRSEIARVRTGLLDSLASEPEVD